MCYKVSPVLLTELEEAILALKTSGRAKLPRRDPSRVVPDAYPGSRLATILPAAGGGFEAAELTWGFDAPSGGRGKYVYNTRIETALDQAGSGQGLWAGPISCGRCLVPVRGFFERNTLGRDKGADQVRFVLAGHGVFLLAGVQEKGRLSVVTTRPNADVARFHSRMPLVLGPGESALWLGPEFALLADRSSIRLAAEESSG